MEEPRWTLDELAERVDAALAVDYHGQPSGRVRAVPDRRAIRWYTTIGLIDRPVAHRGRTALYGPRHLLQLVAVKRLQAEGLPLVAIQEDLAGATDTRLAQVARVPGGAGRGALPASALLSDTPDGGGSPGKGGARSRRAAVASRAGGSNARRAGFWRQQPAASFIAAAADALDPTDPADSTDPTDPADRIHPTDPAGDPAGTALRATLRGVRLGEGATLLLEPGRELDAADVHAIFDAARPLLAVLGDRGLGGRTGDPGSRRTGGTELRREHP